MGCASCGQRYRSRKIAAMQLKRLTVKDTRNGLSKTVSAPPTSIPENLLKASDNSTLNETPVVQVQPKEGLVSSDPSTEKYLPATGQCAKTGKPEETSLDKSVDGTY